MGADGDITANAWYRTNITVPETGIYTLKFSKIRERVALFLNGIRLDSGKAFTQIDVNLKVGEENTIALFTAHDGRNKEIFYVGPVDTVDVKGLAGPISLHKDNNRITTVGPWRMKGGPGNPNSRIGWTRGLPKAKEAKPMFYRSKFEGYGDPKDGMTWRLITSGLTYGSVWVNGHNLGRYPEKIKINGLYIPNNWIRKGKNSVVIYDEGGALPNRVSVQAEVGSSRDVTMLTENPR
jgi:beta-galactosidase